MKSFDIEAWQKARAFAKQIYELSQEGHLVVISVFATRLIAQWVRLWTI
jgi:hypothetical protein